LARGTGAIIDILIAVFALEASIADAGVAVDAVNALSVLAWIGCAIVNVDFARGSRESDRALASEVIDAVDALSVV